MRQAVANIISVIFSAIKFFIMKIFNWKGFIVYPIQRFSPNVVTEFNHGSQVVLEKKVRVHSGCKLKVRSGACLHIGANAHLNYNCILVCRDAITIGSGSELGPGVLLYDHDHDFRAGLKNAHYKSAPITIGKNCWIGANTVILRGTTLGDNCVIGAGCVINGTIESNTIITQKRENTLRIIGANG